VKEHEHVVPLGDKSITLRDFEAVDLGAVLDFANALPRHDLLFLSRDIRHPKVIAAWRDAIADGMIKTQLAYDGNRVVGSTAIVSDPLGWSAHVADIRLLIAEDYRGRGLGRLLLKQSIETTLEDRIEKLIARMTPDQRGAIALFEEMGFRGEAMLRDHVKDADGNLHDLAILSLNVANAATHRQMLGLADPD
jgi:RimJ/RimL family protein N-acetyltransferase